MALKQNNFLKIIPNSNSNNEVYEKNTDFNKIDISLHKDFPVLLGKIGLLEKEIIELKGKNFIYCILILKSQQNWMKINWKKIKLQKKKKIIFYKFQF